MNTFDQIKFEKEESMLEDWQGRLASKKFWSDNDNLARIRSILANIKKDDNHAKSSCNLETHSSI